MADEKTLNEEFQYNVMLAKALVQLLPAPGIVKNTDKLVIQERQLIRIWFDKLAELDGDLEEMMIRNEYIWFILLMLQNSKVIDFFKKIPPEKIHPLKNAISTRVIEDVLISSDQNMAWLESIAGEDKEQTEDKRRIAPENFLDSQPLPKEGIICYFGAFSDHS